MKNKLIENIKTEHMYQRYNGIISKYIVDDEYYIDTKTGIAINKNQHLFLGKTSKNIIDLIEVGDIVEIYIIGSKICIKIEMIKAYYQDWIEDLKTGKLKLISIVTKEQYNQNCYRLEE